MLGDKECHGRNDTVLVVLSGGRPTICPPNDAESADPEEGGSEATQWTPTIVPSGFKSISSATGLVGRPGIVSIVPR